MPGTFYSGLVLLLVIYSLPLALVFRTAGGNSFSSMAHAV